MPRKWRLEVRFLKERGHCGRCGRGTRSRTENKESRTENKESRTKTRLSLSLSLFRSLTYLLLTFLSTLSFFASLASSLPSSSSPLFFFSSFLLLQQQQTHHNKNNATTKTNKQQRNITDHGTSSEQTTGRDLL